MKLIPLTQGMNAIVDDEDFEMLSKYKWCAHHQRMTFYVRRTIRTPRKTIHMHREILDAPKEMQVDHKNGNGLDNRKINLRLCSQSQNLINRGINKNNRSGFKGVSWNKQDSKWSSHIRVNNKLIHLGYFDDPKKAYAAYRNAAQKYFGEFARSE